MNAQHAIDAALRAIETAGADALTAGGKDATAALNAARAYVAQFIPDTEQLVTAAAEATARGEDASTWTDALRAQAQAAALNTVRLGGDLSDAEAARLRDVAMGAVHTAIGLIVTLLLA